MSPQRKASIVRWILVGIGALIVCALIFARSQGVISFGAQVISTLILIAAITAAGIWVGCAGRTQNHSRSNS